MERMASLPNLEKNDFFRRFENLDEMVWVGGAFVSYLLSLICGTIDSGFEVTLLSFSFDIVSFGLWLAFGLVTLGCLYMAFFDMWIHGLRLLVVYFLAGAGVIVLRERPDDSIYLLAGIVCIAGALLIILEQLWTITKIRVKLHESSNVEDEEAFSLGFWYLLPFLFLMMSVFAFYSWYDWYAEDSSLFIYGAFELIIIVIVIAIMWIPQNVLYYGQNVPMEFIQTQREMRHRRERHIGAHTEDTLPETPRIGSFTSVFSRTQQPLMRIERCTQCNDDLHIEHKKCPHCGHVFEFGWCPRCEVYNFNCPSCNNPTIFGKQSCDKCRASLSRIVECPDCHRKFPLRRLKETQE